MKWIHDFQLFLFDFDGLLVNTEHLHYQAYVNVLAKRGYRLDWSFGKWCEMAHLSGDALREGIYAEFPDLDPNWDLLYAEKKQAYFDLLSAGKVEMMPGAESLLKALAAANIRRAVVTNASLPQVQVLSPQLPVLKTLKHWITREDYENPKPHPECYLRAIQLHGEPGDKIIGFEDSIRGLQALRQTPALPVLICPSHHPLLELASEGVLHFESLAQIPNEKITG